MCFNLVVNSGTLSFSSFLNPFNSVSILSSSCPSNTLKVIGVLLWGNVKANSFLPSIT